ncbi:ribosome-associated translation inhibitor RaiA [Patescibacteria group bacterium]|nr:ribosome-associated translation inhibitor RaiA [Patescibacteria group bacterium]
MEITFYSKTNTLSDEIKDYASNKIHHLEKYLHHAMMGARIELEEKTAEHSGEKYRAEATIDLAKGLLRAEANGRTFQEAIDLIIPKLKSQIERYKTKKRGIRE